ncbi:thiaminase (transcriptional activator TenA) [Desulfonispora thiosulfatigenes DSM 11270]|uniref:Aminopyrimidine aminohydrolase n=1 Tax=Desulfonispora thiosulfatigenes DSM 11270 TaxID=656914 RepID=A0A1W1UCQ6_DESTI|nr:thiaminase II [Desulfonispora thiosulfatigenes]SMB78839.1 thiaminase (transcriptional activator TenA) [Desulfonispora thiosulfatigenes DSM 11270]
MSFAKMIIEDQRVKKYYEDYMKHPFIKGLGDGSLEKEKFKKYLIQDTLYLKDYGKVYAHAFLLSDRIEDLQFLHTCIGVVIAEETNMHIRYLKDFNLDVFMIDNMKIEPANRAYLDYMLSFKEGGDIKEIFMSALPCTLTYEYIGKTLKEQCIKNGNNNAKDNYYYPWIEDYAGEGFEDFSIKSCELVDRICKDIDEEEKEKLMTIFLEACRYEMGFWDMSFE